MKTYLATRGTGISVIWLLVVLFGVGTALATRVYYPAKKSLSAYADDVYEKCAPAPHAPSCYDEEIPRLMDRISMEEAFEVTRFVQQKDPRYLYCHVLGHNISYREADRDVSKWKDVVARCPTTFCNNGCQHGALMRRFNAESLTDAQIQQVKPDLQDVCEPRGNWNPREVERSMCYHALGHLHMFMTNADINKSVNLCQDVATKPDGRNYVQTCTQGVLMSVYQPLEPEDFALVRGLTPTKETVNAFCDQFTGEAWFACHSESWPLFLQDMKEPAGLMRFCSYTDEPYHKKNCIGTGMSILTVLMVVEQGGRLDTLTAYCDQLSGIHKGDCYAHAAFRLVQIDPRYTALAKSVCDAASQSGVGDACFSYLLQHVDQSFAPGQEADAFCSAFEEPWQTKCSTRTY